MPESPDQLTISMVNFDIVTRARFDQEISSSLDMEPCPSAAPLLRLSRYAVHAAICLTSDRRAHSPVLCQHRIG